MPLQQKWRCMLLQKIISRSVQETIALGKRLAWYLKAGDLVALVGVFGAGKTYFTKGIARGLGIKKWREVNSPSFVLCNVYRPVGAVHEPPKSRHGGRAIRELPLLYHFDAQRLSDAKEFLRLGLTEAFVDGVCVMEWADKWPGLMGLPNVLRVGFKLKGKNKRLLEFSGKGKQWVRIIKELIKEAV